MELIYKNFPKIIEDNEEHYYISLKGVIESVDPDASILVTRRIAGITIRILPSTSAYLDAIIREINTLNTLFGLRVEFSKSIKTTISINFNIDF